jgi:hypothetical protein
MTMNGTASSRPSEIILILSFVGICTVTACLPSSAVDPRCSIDADGRHHTKLAQTINGSKLWQKYFEVIDPDGKRRLVDFHFSVDRSQQRSSGGDYDAGKITVVFGATNVSKGQTLYNREEEVDLDAFMVGFFDKDITREKLQEIAFKATEDRVYPYLATWIDIAAIKAMGQEGSGGYEFEDQLQALLDDQWSNLEIQTACRDALAKIRG